MVMDEAAACRPFTSPWVPLEPRVCVCVCVWVNANAQVYTVRSVFACTQMSHTCAAIEREIKAKEGFFLCVCVCVFSGQWMVRVIWSKWSLHVVAGLLSPYDRSIKCGGEMPPRSLLKGLNGLWVVLLHSCSPRLHSPVLQVEGTELGMW